MKRSPEHLRAVQALFLTAALTLYPDAAKSRTFEFVERVVDSRLSVPRAIAISHDGRHVYVGAYQTLVFARDASTGELAYRDALEGSQAIAISPDDRHIYQVDHRKLTALTRDASTGALAQVEAWQAGNFVALSPDGGNVYVTTLGPTLLAFTRDPRTGVIDLETQYDGVGGVDGLGGSVHVSVSPNGAQVAVVSLGGIRGSSVTVFDRDPDDGSLNFSSAIFGGSEGIQAIDGARFSLFSLDGRHLYVAGFSGIAAFARNTRDRKLRFISVTDGRTDALEISPDNRFLYAVTDLKAEVRVFSRDADSGALDPVESFSDGIEELHGFEGLAASPDGENLYLVSDHIGSAVAALQRDDVTGKLELLSIISGDVDGDFDGIRAANSLAASSDGKNLYVTTDRGRVTALSRSAASGRLSAVDSYHYTEGFDGLEGAESVTVSPDGLNVYIASQRPDALIALTRDATTGELGFLETHFDGEAGVDGLDLADSVIVSPDGRSVYVVGTDDDALAVFDRDTSSGHLEFLEVHIDDIAGVEGLSRPTAVTVSPGGRHIYVVGIDEAAVATFQRDTETGRLDFLRVTLTRDPVSHADLLVSPDGRNLYVGGGNVSVFVRDPATGELDLLEAHSTLARSLAISPEGETLYAVSFAELNVFSREPMTGALRLIEAESYISSLDFQAAVLSPNGQHLYFPSGVESDDAITVLRRGDGPCRATAENLCLVNNRFRVDIEWKDFTGQTGIARGVPYGSGDSGLLWFFNSENWEMLIKVLDGCSINDRFWVLAAGTTDVQYTLRVTDLLTDSTQTYSNPLGAAAPAIVDTDAFATCHAAGETGGTSSNSLFAPAGSDFETKARTEDSQTIRRQGPNRREELPIEPGFEKRSEPNSLLIGVGEKCLDIEGGVGTDGSPVHLFECHRKSNQRWKIFEDCGYGGCIDFEIRGLDDLCLQPAAGSTATTLIVGPCDGPEDRWSYSGYFPERIRLEHVATGLCADVEGSNTEDGTPVNLYDCHDGANQLWDFRQIRCIESPIHHCLNEKRFLVDVEWRDFEGRTGHGRAVRQGSPDSGMYWFFTPNNWELLVKVLDGCAVNSHHWVFSAATTNIEYTLKITDIQTGQIREYFNPLGQAASAITDTSAFNTCP